MKRTFLNLNVYSNKAKLLKKSFCSDLQFITTSAPKQFEEIKTNLLQRSYTYFTDQVETRGFGVVISELKSFQSNLSHAKENKVNRELILRSNEALEMLAIYNRTPSDHENFTSRIDEHNVYQVYNAFTKKMNKNKDDVQALLRSSDINNRQLYSYQGIISSPLFKSFVGELAVSAGLITYFKAQLAILLGPWGPLGLFAGLGYLTHQSLARGLNNAHVLKSLSYNQFTKIVTLDYYNCYFLPSSVSFPLHELKLEYFSGTVNYGQHYLIQSPYHRYIIPLDNSNISKVEIDHKLLNEIFNSKNKDSLVESLLIKSENLIDLTCKYTSNPNDTLDMLIRTKMLSEKEDISKIKSKSLIHIKLISIPDEEVAAYKEQQLNKVKSVETKQELPEIEELLRRAGIEKAKEVTQFLFEKFDVSTVYHFKNIGDYEINQAAIFLKMSREESRKFLVLMYPLLNRAVKN